MIQENKNIFLNFLFLKVSSRAYVHLTRLKKELAIFGFYHPKTVNTHRLIPHQLLLPSQPVKCPFAIGRVIRTQRAQLRPRGRHAQTRYPLAQARQWFLLSLSLRPFPSRGWSPLIPSLTTFKSSRFSMAFFLFLIPSAAAWNLKSLCSPIAVEPNPSIWGTGLRRGVGRPGRKSREKVTIYRGTSLFPESLARGGKILIYLQLLLITAFLVRARFSPSVLRFLRGKWRPPSRHYRRCQEDARAPPRSPRRGATEPF